MSNYNEPRNTENLESGNPSREPNQQMDDSLWNEIQANFYRWRSAHLKERVETREARPQPTAG